MRVYNTFGLGLIAVLLLFPWDRAFADPILTLNPVNGVIAGAPGSTVGWGFTITNAVDFIDITSASFTPATPLGTFTDFISQFNFIVVGPSPESPTVSQVFNSVARTGIGSFTIDSGAPVGSSAAGQIVLTYDLFSVSPNDPNFDPTIDTISTDNVLVPTCDSSAPCTAQVNVVSGVPEPSTLQLLISAMGGLAAYGAWRSSRKLSIARRMAVAFLSQRSSAHRA